MSIPKPRVPGICCPHCDSRAIARSSECITNLCRKILFRCDNDACGHVFVAQLAIVHTTRKSALPRDGVHLPFRPAPTGGQAPANDRLAPSAGIVLTSEPGALHLREKSVRPR